MQCRRLFHNTDQWHSERTKFLLYIIQRRQKGNTKTMPSILRQAGAFLCGRGRRKEPPHRCMDCRQLVQRICKEDNPPYHDNTHQADTIAKVNAYLHHEDTLSPERVFADTHLLISRSAHDASNDKPAVRRIMDLYLKILLDHPLQEQPHTFRPFRTVASFFLSSHPQSYLTCKMVVAKPLSAKESSKPPSRTQRRARGWSHLASYGIWHYRMNIHRKSSTHRSYAAAESIWSYGAAQTHSRATRGRRTRKGQ